LISAEEGNMALVNINGLGEARIDEQHDFSFGEYKILLESIRGEPDKIMEADFEVIRLQGDE
jgi:hypothetical protein